MTNSTAVLNTSAASAVAQLYRDDAFRMTMTSCPREVVTLAQVFHADIWTKSLKNHPEILKAKTFRTQAAFNRLMTLWLSCQSPAQRQQIRYCCEVLNSTLAIQNIPFWN